MTQRVTPITRYTRRIASSLRRAADGDETHLTLTGLVELLGPRAHRLLLLVVSLFNMIPGPPGYGGTIAWTTCAIAVAMLLGKQIRLPGIIGKRRLPLDLMIRASEQVVTVAGILARFSRPRLRWLTGAAANLPYAILVIGVSVVMALPVPFINAIPNVGLCIIAFSMLNRDGAGVIVGIGATAVGLGVAIAIVVGAFHLGMAAVGSMG
ncbi:exopolysaccharide biosynthesis protein [Devosia sp. XJ19-1]|uniref:Exopolysaccharide biosynthesis protein n=1 Tax=Devosia ureilytica TaxID=2952754 RepID=A0A9Q4FRP6_9HYPH|nr:exopolysaccharide biosynthesis protein [Devosia ureilytica]MCP8886060.1 exopolysaccharide biosynthesis protein [Devosia ureilytica]